MQIANIVLAGFHAATGTAKAAAIPAAYWRTSSAGRPAASLVSTRHSSPTTIFCAWTMWRISSATERALQYMALEPNKAINDILVDKVFIGSCTNSRIEDMRAAAWVVQKLGKRIASNVKLAMVVPGSGLVKEQAEREGLDKIFKAAGFEWREPGCSMCLGMNPDTLERGQRCAATSNRNFEGRQGKGGRTFLASPLTAVAAAVTGKVTDVRTLIG